MNRDEIIRMAVDAGIIPWTKHEYVGGKNFSASDEGLDGDLASLIQFAELVASAEREAWEHRYARLQSLMDVRETQPNKPCCLAEREACAQIAEYKLDNKGLTAPDSPKEWWNYACQNIRDAIRARGQA